MLNPRENKLIVDELLEKVKQHPLCLRMIEDDHYFVVVYPDGELPSDGIRISKASKYGGQAVNLMLLLIYLEKVWLDTTPGFKELAKYAPVYEVYHKLKNNDIPDKKELKEYLIKKLEEVGI